MTIGTCGSHLEMSSKATLDKLRFFFMLAASMIFLSGCIETHPYRTQWRSGLLYPADLEALNVTMGIADPCRPPCWQGITPGESTTDDVMSILNRLDIISTDSIRPYTDEGGTITVVTWESALANNQVYGGSIRLEDGIVVTIEVVVEYALSIQDVIDEIGDPPYYEILPYGPESTASAVRFTWPSYGLSASLPEYAPGTRITSDRHILRLLFSIPSDDLFDFLVNRYGTAQFMQSYRAWGGFQDLTLP